MTESAAPADRAALHSITEHWGTKAEVSLYLGRCQVDTPPSLVQRVWRHVHELRPRVSRVVDFGAGDGRFALGGNYHEYIGYEVDDGRYRAAMLPPNARLLHECAFEQLVAEAELCIGNPPYVRNQDLPEGWRQKVAQSLRERTAVKISGLANALSMGTQISPVTGI